MHTKVAITRKLGASAERAWAAVEAADRLDVWFPVITGCTVEGTGAGAERRITLDGGMGGMLDIIRSVEPEQRRLTYDRVESPFPVSSFLGTVEVFTSFDGLAVVAWTVDFESEPDMSAAVTELVTSSLNEGLAGMDADLDPPPT